MAKRKKKSSGIGFTAFMLIYTVVLCAAAAFGLRFLWNYMDAYEKAKSTAVVDRYEQEQLQAEYDRNLEEQAQALATPLQSGDEILDYIRAQLGEVSLRLKKEHNTDTAAPPIYSILMNRQEVGKLYTRFVPLPYGLQGIAIDRTEWNLETVPPESFEVIAPKEAKVSINGVELNDQVCRTEIAEHSVGDLTQGFDPVFDTMYSFEYYGVPEPAAAAGQDVDYIMEQDENGLFSVFAQCDEQTASVIEPIAEVFVKDYILFTSHAAPYYVARNHMVPDSPLYNRVSGSVDGMRWVSGVTSTISDLTIDHIVPYGDGIICDAHYKLTDTVGGVMDSNMRILLVQLWGNWKVYNIQMY